MTGNDHPTDLVHLVQHVALNQSGWWEQAVERLLLACAYTAGSCSRNELYDAVRESSGVITPPERLAEFLDRLLQGGSLVEHQGLIRVSEETREDLHQYEQRTMSSEQRARAKFDQAANDARLADRSDELWKVLETEIILPITRYMGARLYELLTSQDPESRIDILTQLEEIEEKYDEELRDFFYDYIDPSDDDIRGFVLRRLTARYIADAAALPAAALDRLADQRSVPSRVRILVDTNFLFSILGLHDNPGNEEANKLLQLIDEVSNRVNLQLYVLPITIEEARTVLSDVAFRLQGFRGQPSLAEAARRTTSLGLAERYFEAASHSPTNLSPKDFFGPYESDLLTVLRSKSVELYNVSLDDLRMDQGVIDDMHELSEIQRRHRRRGEKSYEANLHDMVMMHFARSQRIPGFTSPLEVTIWVVTLDYGLMSFERRHLQAEDDQPPICLEPASVIQLFQFWVPSSLELDEALVGSVRQPLLFLKFGVESEQVTLRILAQLSRFDAAGDLSTEVAMEILTNDALRQRISSTDREAENDQSVVDNELLQMINQLMTERDTAIRDARSQTERADKAARLVESVARERERRRDAEERLTALRDTQHATTESVRAQLGDQLSDRDLQIADLERKNRELEDRIDGIDEAADLRKIVRRGWLMSLSSVLVSLGVLIGGAIALTYQIATGLAWAISGTSASLVLLVGLDLSFRRTPVADSRIYAGMKRLRSAWWAFGVAVAASLVAAWIGKN